MHYYTLFVLMAFYALDHNHQTQSGHGYVISAGRGWAWRAHSILLGGDLSTVSVENLMATMLLHDYQLRVGNYAPAFPPLAITPTVFETETTARPINSPSGPSDEHGHKQSGPVANLEIGGFSFDPMSFIQDDRLL
ncbi:hypothetical protein GGR54DRAFT_564123 [Hypoxylon sp. NC1633]|nr:hypothetical protein GGR54DRAFT_564123 [Hypoxylon sp. NC1633]